MPLRSHKFAIWCLCLVPALSAEVHTSDEIRLASFFYACPSSHAKPLVEAKYVAETVRDPRPSSASVGVFLRGKQPSRPYLHVGEVTVIARDRRTDASVLISHASGKAREFGGDALIDVWWSDEVATKPAASKRGRLYLHAVIVSWV